MQDDHEEHQNLASNRAIEEWMLICQRNSDLQPNSSSQQDFDWSLPAQTYYNLKEMPSFIAQQQQSVPRHTFTTSADPQHLQEKQLEAYKIVLQHKESEDSPPIRMIVSGTAGTVNLIQFTA